LVQIFIGRCDKPEINFDFLRPSNTAKLFFILDTIATNLNLKDKNRINLMGTIENNSLKPLQKNGMILSYKREMGLSGEKYKIFLRDKRKLRLTEIPESPDIKEED